MRRKCDSIYVERKVKETNRVWKDEGQVSDPMLISSHVYSTFTHTHGLGFSLIYIIITVQ